MARFFVEKVFDGDEYINLSAKESNHASNVLRLRPGERIIIFDNYSNEFDAEIVEHSKQGTLARIINKVNNEYTQKLNITLFQAVPKFDKMEYIIQKCIEVGVNNFVPVLTDRTIVRFDDENSAAKRVERWMRISLETIKQCRGNVVPRISMPVKFNDAVKMGKTQDLCLIPYEKESMATLRGELSKAGKSIMNIGVYIGPEGGFSECEIEYAAENGIMPISLGNRILRTETAGLVVASILFYEFGEI